MAGVGAATNIAAQRASRQGFDDPGVRESSKDLLSTIIGESEDRGQAAANALQRPQLTSQANDLLSKLLTGDGNDPITQSLMADFENSAGKARAQQIEDLQRFGVLGGDQGPSAGFTADILGEFDSGIERGRSGVRAGGFDRLLNSVLPQATALGGQQFGQDLTRLQLQQDVANQSQARRMPLTGPTGDQVFQESVRQSGIGNNFQQQGIDLQRGGLTGQYRDPVTGVMQDTLGRQQLNQQGSQFDRSAGQGDRSLDQQLAALLGQTSDGTQTLQGSQFDRQNNLATVAQIIAAQQAGVAGFDNLDVADQLRQALGIAPARRAAGTGDGEDVLLNDNQVNVDGLPQDGSLNIMELLFGSTGQARGGDTPTEMELLYNSGVRPELVAGTNDAVAEGVNSVVDGSAGQGPNGETAAELWDAFIRRLVLANGGTPDPTVSILANGGA